MDYKYIEQLLERYWQGDTTLEEEQILHSFFAQQSIPAELEKYRPLFACANNMRREETLDDEFDSRILSMIEANKPVKAHVITMRRRLMPLFKAAALVAIVITLGNVAQISFDDKKAPESEEINYAAYQDTFSDPEMAYDRVHSALELVSEGFSHIQKGDSIGSATDDIKDQTLKE
ncbi:MAG: hypothetical protein ACI4TW_04700 [Prevotella sp.]